MELFYIPQIAGDFLTMSAEESRHCIRVLRLQKGDSVSIIDGKGSLFEAVILNPDSRNCTLRIESKVQHTIPRPYRLTIAIAPTKNMDRFEWFLEKATEIGVDRIIPVICSHSERRELKPERLEKILISALKQSGQLFLPELTKIIPFKELISQSFEGEKMIAHCDSGARIALHRLIRPGRPMLIAIGPEGDFAPDEIRMALDAGFSQVTLGESRLRTETAGIVACHTVALVNQQSQP